MNKVSPDEIFRVQDVAGRNITRRNVSVELPAHKHRLTDCNKCTYLNKVLCYTYLLGTSKLNRSVEVCFFDDADIYTTFGFTNTTSTSTKKYSLCPVLALKQNIGVNTPLPADPIRRYHAHSFVEKHVNRMS